MTNCINRRQFLVRTAAGLLVPFAFPRVSWGQTRSSDGSHGDTQTKINASANGDTVLLPPAQAFSWTGDVVMPSDRAITLDLNSSTITINGSGIDFRIQAHATLNNRLTNGNLVRGTGYSASSGPFKIEDDRGKAGVIVDHVNFSGSDVILEIGGKGPGCMYLCNFTGLTFGQEVIHVDGWGAGNNTGWINDTGDELAGSANVFCVEECAFTQAANQAGVSWAAQGYYGCRIDFNRCTFDHCSVDMHGTAGNIGARWWSFRRNTWKNTVGGTGSSPAMNIRAGSGVCHNNTATGSGYSKQIQLCEEDNVTYPALWQVGRGKSTVGASPTLGSHLALDPAKIWDNDGIIAAGNVGDAEEVLGMVNADRDFYEGIARSGYVEQSYPHYLRVGGAPAGATPGKRGARTGGGSIRGGIIR